MRQNVHTLEELTAISDTYAMGAKAGMEGDKPP